eukprot:TRINITY_DN6210_c0_g1_i1.p1 TRINITY_DN6210_c0_g1~~TRINITY_DN6210_c0_g1_i1.p1  ORF type:complete len:931 (-),score=70.34 TRINITY_DN6210_c0_g1_i1:48-2840(-)
MLDRLQRLSTEASERIAFWSRAVLRGLISTPCRTNAAGEPIWLFEGMDYVAKMEEDADFFAQSRLASILPAWRRQHQVEQGRFGRPTSAGTSRPRGLFPLSAASTGPQGHMEVATKHARPSSAPVARAQAIPTVVIPDVPRPLINNFATPQSVDVNRERYAMNVPRQNIQILPAMNHPLHTLSSLSPLLASRLSQGGGGRAPVPSIGAQREPAPIRRRRNRLLSLESTGRRGSALLATASPEMHRAARTIQRVYRGYRARREAAYLRLKLCAATKIQAWMRRLLAQPEIRDRRREMRGLLLIQAVWRGYCERRRYRYLRALEKAVRKVQGVYRRSLTRIQQERLIIRRELERRSAVTIQHAWRAHVWRRNQHRHHRNVHAATEIQRLARGMLARKAARMAKYQDGLAVHEGWLPIDPGEQDSQNFPQTPEPTDASVTEDSSSGVDRIRSGRRVHSRSKIRRVRMRREPIPDATSVAPSNAQEHSHELELDQSGCKVDDVSEALESESESDTSDDSDKEMDAGRNAETDQSGEALRPHDSASILNAQASPATPTTLGLQSPELERFASETTRPTPVPYRSWHIHRSRPVVISDAFSPSFTTDIRRSVPVNATIDYGYAVLVQACARSWLSVRQWRKRFETQLEQQKTHVPQVHLLETPDEAAHLHEDQLNTGLEQTAYDLRQKAAVRKIQRTWQAWATSKRRWLCMVMRTGPAIVAATVIQAAWRGFQTRKHLARIWQQRSDHEFIEMTKNAVAVMQSVWRAHRRRKNRKSILCARREDRPTSPLRKIPVYTIAFDEHDAVTPAFVAAQPPCNEEPTEDDLLEEERNLQRQLQERELRIRSRFDPAYARRYAAACTIQRAWRCHAARREYYKALADRSKRDQRALRESVEKNRVTELQSLQRSGWSPPSPSISSLPHLSNPPSFRRSLFGK